MKSLKLLIGDPAHLGSDAFGVIGLEATYPERKIYIRYAKQHWKKPYSYVANHFSALHKQFNFDKIIIEKNFDYENVASAFAHLPITYISTSSGLSEETRAKGWAVDKPFMINWLKQEYKKHTIQYPNYNPPNKMSKDMAELINQRNEMVGITAPSGHVSYKRTRNRHDDLFLGELIGCNAIRIWWDLQ